MAVIKPFKAIRPKEGLEDKIAALPYDVYSREEAREKVKNDNYTFRDEREVFVTLHYNTNLLFTVMIA